jgi:predicted dehydrogenase
MSRLRTAVVGVGRLGGEHARILSGLPGSELVGVHDLDGERGRAVARERGTRHFEELEALLAAADAVVVAVPTVAHHAVARAALEAGCHVLVEKPFTETLDEADDLIRRAEARGRELGVGHVERFNGAVRGCEPHLDEPRFIESLRLAPFQPRGTDVTVVLDLMIHDIDLVLGLVDSPLASLHAVGTPVLTDSVDIANARLVFEDGAVAEITASRVSEEKTRMLRLFQRTGYIRLDLALEEPQHRVFSSETRLAVISATLPSSKTRRALAMSTESVRTGVPTAWTDASSLRASPSTRSMSWIIRSRMTVTSVPRGWKGARRSDSMKRGESMCGMQLRTAGLKRST